MKRLAATAFALTVFALALLGVMARVLDTALLPSLRTPAVSVIYDRHGTELAYLLPSATSPSGSGPAGSGPAGSGPAGSGPAGSGPAGTGRPVTGRVPATLVSLEAMAPAFVAAATTVTQSQNLRVSAPDLLERLWNGVTGSDDAGMAGAATGTADVATLAELYVELTEPDEAPISGVQPKSINDRLSNALLTNRVERGFSEPELLELYLNVASYGRNAYGASAAAQAWFGTSIADLNVGQSAFLAAWVASPSLLESSSSASSDISTSPSARLFTGTSSDTAEQFARVTEARNAVLFEMYEADDITAAELEDARATRVDELLLPYQPATQVELLVNDAELAPVINTVFAQLVDRYGARAVTFGGLHVVTTIDLPYQRTALGSVASPDTSGTADASTATSAAAGTSAATDVIVLDDTGGVRAAVGDVFAAAHRSQELTANLLPGGETLLSGDEVLLSGSEASSVLDVGTAFSVLSHNGVLRPTHLVLSVGTAPPFELLQQLSQRNSSVSEEVLATATNATSGGVETERHVINRVRVLDQTAAERLTSGLMQPFAQLVAQVIAVPAAPSTDAPSTDSPSRNSSVADLLTTDLLTTDLPVRARIVSPPSTASSSDAAPADGSGSDTPPTATSPDATSWLAGWSEQSLVVMRAADSVAAAELATSFAALMQGLHYWSVP